MFNFLADFGNFSFEMDLYKTEEYKEAIEEYPLDVQLNEWMYIQTSVKSNDSKLALFNDKCWATPSSDANDKENYVLLEKG